MPRDTFPYVILGGGLVAGYAARAFAKEASRAGQLCILSAEAHLPYDRPPLSKDFLAGDKTREQLRINPPEFYQEHDIEVRLDQPATGLELNERLIHTDAGSIRFDKLLVATGAHVKRLDAAGDTLAGVTYLRHLHDAETIRERAEHAERAIIVGGGFIGTEVASVLVQQGLEVTLISRSEQLLPGVLTPELAGFLEDTLRQAGVDLQLGAQLTAFRGERDLEAVVLDSGKSLQADLAVVGIGVEPNITLFKDTAIERGDGLVVDDHLRTSHEAVWAAGDVANVPAWGRLEHWDDAMAQAEVAIKNMLGQDTPYRQVPHFFSTVMGRSYEMWGKPKADARIIHRGAIEQGQGSAWWLEEKRLVAALLFERPYEERLFAVEALETSREIDPEELADDDAALEPSEA